jgi:outer membrane protein OmpA-like peptidoglycan-associated protein
MFGNRSLVRKRSKDEAEKPFWISYADLMTSLMVLFLVAMSVALLAVTKEINAEKDREDERTRTIVQCLQEIKASGEDLGISVSLDPINPKIDFGTQARFAFDKFIVSEDTAIRLRTFVRRLLGIAKLPCGMQWMKRVVIEGYTSQEGKYLHNVNLSLNRSHKVLCVLLGGEYANPITLNADERRDVQKLFMVGGYSSNSIKPIKEESRRVEFKLEFWGLHDPRDVVVVEQLGDLGECKLKDAE